MRYIMLRKFFNVYTIYDKKNNEYLSRYGFTSNLNEIGNFILLLPILGLICGFLNFGYNGKRELRIKKIWMPTVKIDATIYTGILKDMSEYLNTQKVEDDGKNN